MPDTNPLLQHWSLPPWSDIRAEHLLPAINVIVAENQQIIAQVIASQTEHPNWDDLVVAIDSADARLTEAVGIIDTLSTRYRRSNPTTPTGSGKARCAATLQANT